MRPTGWGRGAGLPIDASQLAATLDEFAATVTREFVLDDILRQLALAATRVLRVAGAGVAAPHHAGPEVAVLRMVHAGRRRRESRR